MRPRPATLALAALWMALSTPARAQRTAPAIVGHRSGNVKTAGTTPVGTVVLEGGASASWEPTRRVMRVGELTLKLPMSARADARIGLSSYRWARSSSDRVAGREDMTLSTVVRLLDRAAGASALRPRLGVTLGTSFPTGAPALRGEALRPQGRLAADWSVWGSTTLAANVAFMRDQDHGHPEVEASGGVMAARRLHRRANVYLEGHSTRRRHAAGPAATQLRGGFTTAVSPGLHLDLHASRRLDTGAAALGIGFAQRWFTAR